MTIEIVFPLSAICGFFASIPIELLIFIACSLVGTVLYILGGIAESPFRFVGVGIMVIGCIFLCSLIVTDILASAPSNWKDAATNMTLPISIKVV